MHPYFLNNIRPSPTLEISSKAKKFKERGMDVINLSCGEPDFPTPEFLRSFIKEGLDRGFTKYTPASGFDFLRKRISEILAKNNLSYSWNEIVISCGAKHALFNAIFSLIDTQDEVIVISPFWVSYIPMIYMARGVPRVIETHWEGDFSFTLKDIERVLTSRTKAIIINSPANPTGRVLDRDFLLNLGSLCVDKNIWIVSDEIYQKIIFDGLEHISIASLGEKIRDLTITVDGVSKCLSMTGLRIGWSAAPGKIAERISRIQSHITSNPPSICQYATWRALDTPQSLSFFDFIKEEFSRRRDAFLKELETIGSLQYFRPQGAFYVFVRISDVFVNSLEFSRRLLEEKYVATVPGIAFGKEGFVRLSLSEDIPRLREASRRIKEFLDET